MLLGASLREFTNARPMDVVLVDLNGDPIVSFSSTPEAPPPNATLSTVNVTNTTGVMLAANAARREVYIEHEGTGTVYAAFAATATTTAYTFRISGNNSVRLTLNGYTGVISVIRNAGSSTLRVTEVTT